ncbi:MAG: hypothetical protein Q8934_16390 [Bacillota bacterium]|nr:hypothetical protein [Bacillota bacterium]
MKYDNLPASLLYVFYKEMERNIINGGTTESLKKEIKQLRNAAKDRGITFFSKIPTKL